MAVSFKDPSRYMSGTHNLSVTGSISLFQSAGHYIFSIMIMTIYRKQRLELCDRSESAMLIDFFYYIL